jgi:hypothetical protein
LKALIELKKVGVFASAVVKKRRYWPKYIKGDDIKRHFEGKTIGDDDALAGTLDGEEFHIYVLKDDGYNDILMSTYGLMERKDHETRRFLIQQNRSVKFHYPEVFSNHFKYRGSVDSHNAKRHAPIGLETTWATKTWENRVFAFILAVTEVNVFIASNYFFNGKHESMLDFRKVFAYNLINNPYYKREMQDEALQLRRSKRNSTGEEHELLTLPKKTKFLQGDIVSSVSEYPQSKCMGCGKKVRTYCRCTPGYIRCVLSYAKHFAAAGNVD